MDTYSSIHVRMRVNTLTRTHTEKHINQETDKNTLKYTQHTLHMNKHMNLHNTHHKGYKQMFQYMHFVHHTRTCNINWPDFARCSMIGWVLWQVRLMTGDVPVAPPAGRRMNCALSALPNRLSPAVGVKHNTLSEMCCTRQMHCCKSYKTTDSNTYGREKECLDSKHWCYSSQSDKHSPIKWDGVEICMGIEIYSHSTPRKLIFTCKFYYHAQSPDIC